MEDDLSLLKEAPFKDAVTKLEELMTAKWTYFPSRSRM